MCLIRTKKYDEAGLVIDGRMYFYYHENACFSCSLVYVITMGRDCRTGLNFGYEVIEPSFPPEHIQSMCIRQRNPRKQNLIFVKANTNGGFGLWKEDQYLD